MAPPPPAERRSRFFLVACVALLVLAVFSADALIGGLVTSRAAAQTNGRNGRELLKETKDAAASLSPPTSAPTSSSLGEYRRGKMDKYLSHRTRQCDENDGWTSVDTAREGILTTYLFGDRKVKPTEQLDPDDERLLSMRSCEVFDDETDKESGWQIYRFGPFVGVGGSDWHQVWVGGLCFQ